MLHHLATKDQTQVPSNQIRYIRYSNPPILPPVQRVSFPHPTTFHPNEQHPHSDPNTSSCLEMAVHDHEEVCVSFTHIKNRQWLTKRSQMPSQAATPLEANMSEVRVR